MNSSEPKDFLCHPIADAGKTGLKEKDGFDGGAPMTLEEVAHLGQGELRRKNLRGKPLPPCGSLPINFKKDTAKLTADH